MPDRAVVDPDSYAPATQHAVWKKPHKSEEVAPVINEDIPLSLAEIVDVALRMNPNTKLTWAQARLRQPNMEYPKLLTFRTSGVLIRMRGAVRLALPAQHRRRQALERHRLL